MRLQALGVQKQPVQVENNACKCQSHCMLFRSRRSDQ
ncbi:hypothetical protein J2Z50_003229 [Ensifer mexicanus]|nr:hypothetical protein [Sinorhizobium mexicanum]